MIDIFSRSHYFDFSSKTIYYIQADKLMGAPVTDAGTVLEQEASEVKDGVFMELKGFLSDGDSMD